MPKNKNPVEEVSESLRTIQDFAHDLVGMLSNYPAHFEQDHHTSAITRMGAEALYVRADARLREIEPHLHRVRYWVEEAYKKQTQCQHEYQTVKFAGESWAVCEKCGQGYEQLGRAIARDRIEPGQCEHHVFQEVILKGVQMDPFSVCVLCGKGFDTLCQSALNLRRTNG